MNKLKSALCITLAFAVIVAAFTLLTRNRKHICPVCGLKVDELIDCPICHQEICEYCASLEYVSDDDFNKLVELLGALGYELTSDEDKRDVYPGLFAYGFIVGYQKGQSGVVDQQTEEIMSGADYLEEYQDEYGDYIPW